MPNTRIQIRRSSATATPTNGSLQAGELAYSYNSEKLFIGNTTGTGVIEIGGRYYIDVINAAFTAANTSNAYLISLISSVSAGSNAYADLVGQGANNYMIAVQNGSNTAVGQGANAYSDTVGTNVGAGANAYSNSTFVKLVSGYQTITGNLAVTGSLTVSGNSFTIDTQTLRVSDPLIYLAGNNYVSDIVDIGFVGNYVNATGSNVHTGVFRDATNKEYYVFEGYDKEPNPNHIDTSSNNFTLAVLNATIRTSNLILGGANAITTINNVGVAANAYANLVGAGANSYAAVVVGGFANTNAANASYLSTGTVPSARISGSYTGITGVGTITAGIWNGSTVTVPYGGTGVTSFTSNGILYGNNAGDLKVTAAGTEGQVLQASSTGIPSFAMLDGGTF